MFNASHQLSFTELHAWISSIMFAKKEKSAVTELPPLKFNGLHSHEARRNYAVY